MIEARTLARHHRRLPMLHRYRSYAVPVGSRGAVVKRIIHYTLYVVIGVDMWRLQQ